MRLVKSRSSLRSDSGGSFFFIKFFIKGFIKDLRILVKTNPLKLKSKNTCTVKKAVNLSKGEKNEKIFGFTTQLGFNFHVSISIWL